MTGQSSVLSLSAGEPARLLLDDVYSPYQPPQQPSANTRTHTLPHTLSHTLKIQAHALLIALGAVTNKRRTSIHTSDSCIQASGLLIALVAETACKPNKRVRAHTHTQFLSHSLSHTDRDLEHAIKHSLGSQGTTEALLSSQPTLDHSQLPGAIRCLRCLP